MKNRSALFAFLLLAFVLAVAEDFGHFEGDPVTKWNADGRTMTVLQNFGYVDPKGEEWIAPAGRVVDGASIPRVFWTLIGGPFEGKYRNASIVHDTECQSPHKHNWQSVHRMFYSACRAGGVGMIKAKILFGAVYHFGPRWVMPSTPASPGNKPAPKGLPSPKKQPVNWTPLHWTPSYPQLEAEIEQQTRLYYEDDFIRMELFIRKNPEINLEAIEKLTSEFLRAQITPEQVQAERKWLLEKRRERELQKINPDEIEPYSQSH